MKQLCYWIDMSLNLLKLFTLLTKSHWIWPLDNLHLKTYTRYHSAICFTLHDWCNINKTNSLQMNHTYWLCNGFFHATDENIQIKMETIEIKVLTLVWDCGTGSTVTTYHVPCFFQKLQEKKHIIFKRAEKYLKEYRAHAKAEVNLSRQARKSGNFYVPAESKIAFVMRIRG